MLHSVQALSTLTPPVDWTSVKSMLRVSYSSIIAIGQRNVELLLEQNHSACVRREKSIMAPSYIVKHYFRVLFPSVFFVFSFVFFFLLAAESRPLRPADDRAHARIRERNHRFYSVRPILT